MAFLTPCFVRVEDPEERKKLIKWLKKIGWVFIGPYSKRRKYLLCKPTDKTVTAWVMDEWGAERFENIGYIFCGTSVDLFRALAAMNDEDDREQWFVVDDGFEEEMVCSKSEVDYDYILSCNDHRKATTEEIISYFKNKENE